MIGQIKIGDRIKTPDGVGVVVKMEKYSDWRFDRYGVSLYKNPYSFPISFYFAQELEKVCKCGMPFDDCCCSDFNQR
jgi:hypothetical protein